MKRHRVIGERTWDGTVGNRREEEEGGGGRWYWIEKLQSFCERERERESVNSESGRFGLRMGMCGFCGVQNFVFVCFLRMGLVVTIRFVYLFIYFWWVRILGIDSYALKRYACVFVCVSKDDSDWTRFTEIKGRGDS